MKNILLTLSILTFFISCQQEKTEEASPLPQSGEVIPVRTISLQSEAGTSTVIASGQFTTDDETILSFKTGGIVSSVLVREGDYVKKGQLLATLDLTEINAQVKQAELGLQKVKRDHERAGKLYLDSVVTLEQLENSKTAVEIAQQQYKTAQFNLSNSEIRAPKEGYVLRKFVNSGQIVGPGTPIIMANGAGTSQWILKTAISDKVWSKINVNDPATIEIDAYPDKKYEAYVSHKMESADPSSGAFMIEIKLKSTPKGLATGLFGKATIELKDKIDTWQIPYSALLDGSADKGFVFITQDGKTAQKVSVGIYSIQKDYVEINSGLENAQQIIVAGSAYLKDGSPIKIIQ